MRTRSVKYDFLRTCRSCLCETDNLISMNEPHDDIPGVSGSEYTFWAHKTIGDVMMEFANIEFKSNDGLPQHVCKKCASELQIAFAYKKKCEESDVKLRDYFRQHLCNARVKLEEIDSSLEEMVNYNQQENVQSLTLAEAISAINQNQFRESEEEDGDSHANFETFAPSDDNEMDENDQKINLNGESGRVEDNALITDYESKLDTQKDLAEIGKSESNFDTQLNQSIVTKGVYICEICRKPFKFVDDFNRHKSFHDISLDKKFTCDICQGKFTRLYNLKKHMQIHIQFDSEKYNKGGRCDCPHCGKSFKGGLSNLKAHMRRHTDVKPIVEVTAFEMLSKPNAEKRCLCKICDASFDRLVKLRKHIRSHGTTDPLLQKRIDENQNLCELYQITNSGGWEMTLSDSETDADDSDGDDNEENSTPSSMNDKSSASHRTHTCGSCNRSFDRRYRLIVHMNFEHAKTKSTDFDRFRCINCKQLYPNEEILAKHRRDQCENALKQFICKECGVRFKWSCSLELHTSKVHLRKCFRCDSCGKQFHRVQDFTRHKKTHGKKKKKENKRRVVLQKLSHNDPFIYPREFTSIACRRVGDYKGRKAGHIKLVTCDICKRDFSRKDNLLTHMRTHFPEIRDKIKSMSPDGFLCACCGRCYKTSSNLNVHMRTHTGERRYKCDICEKTFPRSQDLINHRRTHTGERPYPCTVCGKSFSRSNKLAQHMRIHTGERPYKCKYCDFAFKQSNDLVRHTRRHTGEKPYICSTCGARFMQKTVLKQHQLTVGHLNDTPELSTIIRENIEN